MIKINDTLVSLDLLEENFTCDLKKCRGACCVLGDSGAPLLDDEVEKLKTIYDDIKEFLRPEAREVIQENGVYYIDADGEPVTQLNNGKECVFTVFEKDIARCAIEQAFEAGKTDFRKPVSCHLYPVRIRKYKDIIAVNYDKWSICGPAILLGNRKKIPVFRFAKESLIRRFGETWFRELNEAAESYKAEQNK
ncbi:MAG: hypothetical protein A2Y71_07700 [Bacteroidetes bacterium RBG_13_42_15]|nr:MAG: hypothetical protein A2Y71_07700 [Bacteroidetes bacterium RBG_13_42_15]